MEWIKCSVRLPEQEDYYNICINGTSVPGYFYEGKFYDLPFDGSPDFVQPTHWMPLPTAPRTGPGRLSGTEVPGKPGLYYL